MFDGSTATFEKIWRPSTVEVIVTVGDKILMEEQDQPDRKNNINLPGGRADQGEDVLEEAKRELLEETGYESNDWSQLYQFGKDGKVVQEVFYFVARNAVRTQEPHLDAGEKITTKLITLDEFIALADEPRFWSFPQFVIYLLEAKYDPSKKEELKKKIFG